MTTKVYSTTPKRMNEALGLTSHDLIDLDVALKENSYLRLDAGYKVGTKIHYIEMPEGWTDAMMVEALPQLALTRAAITIASTLGTLHDNTASQIADRFAGATNNPATHELVTVQLAFSKENCTKDYAQPVREAFNFNDEHLGEFAAWSMRTAPLITHQMMRRAADITGLSQEVLKTYLPPKTEIGEDLSPDVMESWDNGLKATTAELYRWLTLNPAVENPRYTRYAGMLSLDANQAWQEVDTWMQTSTRT